MLNDPVLNNFKLLVNAFEGITVSMLEIETDTTTERYERLIILSWACAVASRVMSSSREAIIEALSVGLKDMILEIPELKPVVEDALEKLKQK